jgi:hypothetical protein
MTASVIDGPNEVKDATHGFADGGGVAKQIDITGKVPGEFYVLNGSAEEVLKFNKKAPVKELLTFFKRYAWDVAGDPVEAAATGDKPLIWLNVADTDAQAVITTAGLVYGDKQDDYQLFKGNVGEYQFVKNTYNASSPYNHEEQIIFNAGAVVGDPATKTTMEYTNDKMTKSFTVPHVLVSGDLITP